jgi:hypothetical protein
LVAELDLKLLAVSETGVVTWFILKNLGMYLLVMSLFTLELSVLLGSSSIDTDLPSIYWHICLC